MKTILILLFLSLAIILPLSALATCATTDTLDNQVLINVLDTNGNPLNKSSRYWITPAYYTMNGGGVRVVNLGSDLQQTTMCPTSVVQSHSPTDDGIAVYFTPKNPKYEKIVVSTPLNIHFYFDYPLCRNLTVWKVDNLVTELPHTISTGAKLGNPNDLSSWFQIKPLGRNYKLVFCLQGESYCQNIGIVSQSGYHRLVLSKNPKPFVFKLDDRIGMAAEA
ncbi:hypothetical protein BC332_14075 [Capsicum chinense]|nr:hypothetical protein BC332_14075 [Capsicum chinense]